MMEAPVALGRKEQRAVEGPHCPRRDPRAFRPTFTFSRNDAAKSATSTASTAHPMFRTPISRSSGCLTRGSGTSREMDDAGDEEVDAQQHEGKERHLRTMRDAPLA